MPRFTSRAVPGCISILVSTGRHSGNYKRVYAMRHDSTKSYPELAEKAARDFAQRLPDTFRPGYVLSISYDFHSSETYRDVDPQGNLSCLGVSEAQFEAPVPHYYGHAMTGLDRGLCHDAAVRRIIRDEADLMAHILAHLVTRSNLEENYDGDGMPEYVQPHHLHLSAWSVRLNPHAPLGDKVSWMLAAVLEPLPPDPCDCVFAAMIHQFRDSRPTIRDSVKDIRDICGLPRGTVTLHQLALIEERYRIRTRTKTAHPIGFVVFDHHFALRRLPAFMPYDHHYKRFCFIVAFRGHAFSVKNPKLASSLMERGLSFFRAALEAAKWPEHYPAETRARAGNSQLHADSYQLFRDTQHMQPDHDAIAAHVNGVLAVNVAEQMSLVKVSAGQYRWTPLFRLPGQNGMLIEWMKGDGASIFREHAGRDASTWSCAIKGVAKHSMYLTETCNSQQVHGVGPVIAKILARAPWSTFTPTKPQRPPLYVQSLADTERKAASFSMDNIVCMDLETCSVRDTGGTFMVYAVGWNHKCNYTSLIANTSRDLQTNEVLWQAINAWCALETQSRPTASTEDQENTSDNEVGDSTHGKKSDIYVYAHNGARFDAMIALQTILSHAADGDMPTDHLVSNGRLVSFRYKNLLFRDSCLLTVSSLKAAAEACGTQTSKGYLPHRYLQQCQSHEEILQRINSHIRWAELEPYCDWFHDVGDEELHTRVAGRSWEAWRDQQPCRRVFDPHAMCNFRHEMETYLRQDVFCLSEIVAHFGEDMAREFKLDIRVRCTLGSLAERIWQRQLTRPIPQLMDEDMHLLWQRANRGGFCSPLGRFNYTAVQDESIYKVDVTSLYPASAGDVSFETTAGLQQPLAQWYNGFPDAQAGWNAVDFEGVTMSDREYLMLDSMHGVVRISFDQSALPFPFFFVKMTEGSWSTMAPVIFGEEYYITPHVRMAYAHGVKIHLYDCRFTRDTWEPYAGYMGLFAKKKNEADERLATCRANCDEVGVRQAQYARTIPKLFLNGLLGRNNMKLERPQVMLTRDANDIINLVADTCTYQDTTVEEIACGDRTVFRATFKEGSYHDHLAHFNVCPYLSAYMLGYSKMLMQASFQHLASAGCRLLYTDTDSIIFAATTSQWENYAAKFVATSKTFGAMELEGVYAQFLTVGPKKYVCVKPSGDYEWHANGINARTNTKLDVLTTFQDVLRGDTKDIPHFSITAMKNFEVHHSVEQAKRLRFICLKGRVDGNDLDMCLRWWREPAEFALYTLSLQPVGMTRAPQQPSRNARRTLKHPQPSVVYILQSKLTSKYYVGCTNNMQRRLRQHNGEISKGASATSGHTWRLAGMCTGFDCRANALKFEGRLQHCTDPLQGVTTLTREPPFLNVTLELM